MIAVSRRPASHFRDQWIKISPRCVSMAQGGACECLATSYSTKRGPVTILDQKGVELGNTADAVKEAARRAEKIVTEEALNGAPVTQGLIIVTDDNWLRLFEWPFGVSQQRV